MSQLSHFTKTTESHVLDQDSVPAHVRGLDKLFIPKVIQGAQIRDWGWRVGVGEWKSSSKVCDTETWILFLPGQSLNGSQSARCEPCRRAEGKPAGAGKFSVDLTHVGVI